MATSPLAHCQNPSQSIHKQNLIGFNKHLGGDLLE